MSDETYHPYHCPPWHCDKAMKFTGARVTWEGKPNEGFENTHNFYQCVACLTTAALVYWEPA